MTTRSIWRLLIMPPRSGPENMAIDQAIAECYPLQSQPTLRFYRWQPTCLSLGVAQRLERDVDRVACATLGIDIVRRQTGGRAILHDQEVTYSLVTATADPLLNGGSIVASYRAISLALCAGLAQIGTVPELAARPESGSARSAACFDLPSDYEITLQQRKLLGSAQARKRGVVLQHGTLLLHADAERWASVLRLPAELNGAMLAQRMIALDEVLGYLPTFESVVAALVGGFEQSWGITLEPGELSPAEESRAATLVGERYANPAWTELR